jgi:hypothetical protein
LPISINAQIVIDQAGKIGLGTDAPAQAVDIRGITQIIPDPANTSVKFVIDRSGYNGAATIRPISNNSMQIGASSYGYSQIWTYYTGNPSDMRQKENIRNIDAPINLVMKLKGVKYDLKCEFAYNDTAIKDIKAKNKFEKNRKNKIGFLAQDVEKVLPEVVFHDDSTDTYGIDYSKVVPVLVEAIKEQQALIEELGKDLKKLKKNLNNSGNGSSNNTSNDAILYQNTPNPFDQSTVIAYYLPETIQKAVLYIYDMQGNPKKEIPIYDRGRSSVTILASTLYEGMYMYSLIADGVEVDTKRMILTGNN